MAFGKTARAASSKAKKEQVAREMTRKTPYSITWDMVVQIPKKKELDLEVYVAQVYDVTVLCWALSNGQLKVQYVCW